MSTKSERKAFLRKPHTTAFVTSRDRTVIGYRQLGHGPGLIFVHGGMSSGYNHLEMAEAMADAFTIYLPDRRGRGLSGPSTSGDHLNTAIEDMDAILAATGAHCIFGLSSGAIICLEAALRLPAVHKAAIFEPPLFIADPATPPATLLRFDREMAQGDVAAALITAMKAAQMGPPILNLVPRRLLELLTNLMMKAEDKKPPEGYEPTRTLAATMHQDFQLVVEIAGRVERFKEIRGKVLLLGGSESPRFCKVDLDALERVLPWARRVEFSSLGHAASWNSDRGGTPGPVAQELKQFFA
ncbi:MAG: alpha/beta hydrolase [Candidatus Acidiferrum sp.]